MSDIMGIRMKAADDPAYIAPRIELAASGKQAYADALRRAGDVIGHQDASCQMYYADDPGAAVMGVLTGTDKPAFVVKEQGDWTSVYSLTAALPATAYREMARMAGVHIYNNHDDTFYANQSFITLHARDAGVRTITLPGKHTVYDLISGREVAQNTAAFTRTLAQGETLLLRVTPPLR